MSQPNVATIVHDPRRQAVFTSKSFEIVSVLVQDPGAIAVKADGPYKTLKDLVEAAKANPGKIKVSCGALMGDTHFTGLTFQKATGTKLAIANFDGGVAPAITAMIGGHADASSGARAVAGGDGEGRPGARPGGAEERAEQVPARRADGRVLGVQGGRLRLVLGDRGAGRHAQGDHHRAGDRAQEGDGGPRDGQEDERRVAGVVRPGPEESVKIWEKVEADAKALMAEIQR